MLSVVNPQLLRFRFYMEWSIIFIVLAVMFGVFLINSKLANAFYTVLYPMAPTMGQTAMDYMNNAFLIATGLGIIGLIAWAVVHSTRREVDTLGY